MRTTLYRYLITALLLIGAARPFPQTISSDQIAAEQAGIQAATNGFSAQTVNQQGASALAATGVRLMRVDYKNYSTSRADVATWEQNMKTAGINMVSLGAGRTDWTYFKWSGHTTNWSSDVNSTGVDFLAADATQFGKWAQINALVDVLSPNYIKTHPSAAAVNSSGKSSTDLVSTAQLVNGNYGILLLSMIEYIAANYPVNSISLSELAYRVDGYGADDLALYKAATGKKDWPRLSNGQIDIDNASIGNWRSAALGGFLARATSLAHKYGKQLYMEVGVSVNSLNTATNNYGTNYNVMLQKVDAIIVNANFGSDGYSAGYLQTIAQYLQGFASNKVILSVGLRGASGTTVSSTNLKSAIQAAQTGKAGNLQVNPGSLMTSAHWQVLNSLWGGVVQVSLPVPSAIPANTQVSTSTPIPPATPTKTIAPANTPVSTSTTLPAATPTKTVVPVNTPVSTSTTIPAATPTMTSVPTNTAVPTNTTVPPSTPTKTNVPTNTTVPTNTSVPSATPTNTAVPTNTSVPSATPTKTSVPTNTPVPTTVAASGVHVMRVEYANFTTSRSEVPTWDTNMKAAGINMVALAAGRVEWAYFKWAGHQADWASSVTDTGIDFLADDSTHYGQYAQINAVIDVKAPNYISAHPDKAAINVLGQPSTDLVSSAELVNGAFGQKLLDMVQYIAANYPKVGSISITELSYRIDGYGPDDLALYQAATGASDWPRQSNGQVDIDATSIGNWRSALLGQYLARATAIAHQYGKQLYMDVGVSYGNLGLMTNNKGTNYNVMLQNVDKIVVWDYYGEDGYPPSYSQTIAQFLTQFGLNRAILSVGLWGATSGSTISAADMQAGIQASQVGSMPNIWICPGSLMTSAHWQALDQLWGPH